MTKIDFYILPQSAESARELLACRLTEKAWKLGHSIYLHTHDAAQCQRMDEQLWQFRPDAFLPHGENIQHPTHSRQCIQLGWGEDPGHHHDVLINLALVVPGFFSRFERVTELVCQQENILAASRENWKFYQHRGYPLQSHRL